MKSTQFSGFKTAHIHGWLTRVSTYRVVFVSTRPRDPLEVDTAKTRTVSSCFTRNGEFLAVSQPKSRRVARETAKISCRTIKKKKPRSKRTIRVTRPHEKRRLFRRVCQPWCMQRQQHFFCNDFATKSAAKI